MGQSSSKGPEDNNNDDVTSEIEARSPNGTRVFVAKNRKCTDMLCCILFLVFWLGMIVIAGVGLTNGQPEKLVFGVDFKGRTCGAKTDEYDLRAYKYMIFPRLSEDLYDLAATGADVTDAQTLKRFFGVCVEECPKPFAKDRFVDSL